MQLPHILMNSKVEKAAFFSKDENSVCGDRCRVQQNRSERGNTCNKLHKALRIKMDVLMRSDFKIKAWIPIINPVATTNTHAAAITDVIRSK